MFAQITEPLSRGELLRQIPWLGWYVSMSGAPGVAIALMGSALLGWGLLNLRTRNRRAVVIHLGLCWLPVFVGMLCCGRALNEAITLPGMNAQTIMIGFMTGVAGPIAGLLPALLAIIQLWRLDSTE